MGRKGCTQSTTLHNRLMRLQRSEWRAGIRLSACVKQMLFLVCSNVLAGALRT
jgi:hypothetical protein